MIDYKNLYNIRQEALEKTRLNQDHKERIRIYEEQTIYNPTDNQSTPEILKNLRSAYRGNTLEYLNDLYFETLQKIQQADKENNVSELLFNSQISLGLLEPLIYYNYKHYNGFDIKSIPAINKGLIYYSVNGIIGQIKNIADIVNFFNDFKNYKSEVDIAFERANLSSKIYNLIKNKGEFQHSKLKNELDIQDGRFVATTVGYMIKAKKLDKFKVGNRTFINIK